MTEMISPKRRVQQKQETRRCILQAAKGLFQGSGYETTTMRELARVAGLGLGTLFKHFPDKPSILIATFEDELAGLIDEAFAACSPVDIHRQLAQVVAAIYRYYAENPGFSRVLVKESLFIQGVAGDVVGAQTRCLLERIYVLLDAAAARGEIAPLGSPECAKAVFWSFYLTGLTLGLRDEYFDVDRQLSLFAAMLSSHFPPLSECAAESARKGM